jgi:probable F420-dependent oxidoreductase
LDSKEELAMKFALAVSMCDPGHYLPLARAAEEQGFRSLAVPDGPFYPKQTRGKYPYTEDGERFWPDDIPFLDPWVVIPAMAAVTEKLRFFTAVMKLPLRSPLLVAKTVSSAALLSGGRVSLGVGLSWIPEEFEWCGADWENRGASLDEAIQAIREVLKGGWREFHGKHYDFGPLKMSPPPSAPVPIIVGGHSSPALRRAARYGDGWTSANIGEQELRGYVEQLKRKLDEEGRSLDGFEIQGMPTDVSDAEGFARLESYGVSEVLVWPWALYEADPLSLDAKLESVARFGEQVIAPLA